MMRRRTSFEREKDNLLKRLFNRQLEIVLSYQLVLNFDS